MKKTFAFLTCIALTALALTGLGLAMRPGMPQAVSAAIPAAANACLAEGRPCSPVLLVNRDNPISGDAEPETLVNLYDRERHFQLASSDISVAAEVYEAMDDMFARAEADGVEGFIVTSGYRTQAKQQELYGASADGTAALPGQSEHQTGLAFDVTARRDGGGFETTAQFAWLREHCWDYGFILRYPQGAEDVTGFAYEPWHYRYVGADAAAVIRDNDWTLEEYCEIYGQL